MNYFETILHNAEMIGWTFLFRRSGSVLVKPDVFKIELTHGGDENYETADELVQLINGWYTAYSNAIKNVENVKITTGFEKKIMTSIQDFADAVRIKTELEILKEIIDPVVKNDPRI